MSVSKNTYFKNIFNIIYFHYSILSLFIVLAAVICIPTQPDVAIMCVFVEIIKTQAMTYFV